MKALLSLKSAIRQSTVYGIIALASLMPSLVPHIAFASGDTSGANPAKIFEINISSTDLNQTKNQTNTIDQPSLAFDSVIQSDPLNVYVQAYLGDHNSPFGPFTNTLLSCPDWKRVLAISFVESNMGIHHYYYNSSGIGGQEYLRKYSDYGAWMNDMCKLLQTRYNNVSLERMNGWYVQPASKNWILGSNKIYTALVQLEAKANEQRAELAHNSTHAAVNQELATIAQ